MNKKICTSCGENKKLSEYNINRGTLLQAKCKSCQYIVHYRWMKNNPEKLIEQRKRNTEKSRRLVFDNYGRKCKCCGEEEVNFLSIDHINNDGSKHRAELRKKGGTPFYRWLITNNYPKNFQVLCMNCNWGKRIKGICPHKL